MPTPISKPDQCSARGPADAASLGIDAGALDFSKVYSTANGLGRGASYMLDELSVGPVAISPMPVSVNEAEMGSSLLGMTFLRRFRSFEIQGRPVRKCGCPPLDSDIAPRREPAKDLCDFDVGKVRAVNLARVLESRGDAPADRGIQQQLDGSGCVENDQREFRSSRSTPAAGVVR